MELAGGAGVTQAAGDGPAKPEIAGHAQALWRKSTWSSFNGNCVEVAELPGRRVGVRDTKDGGRGPVLLFEGPAWRSFVEAVKRGRLPG
jgi:hypothetical protein